MDRWKDGNREVEKNVILPLFSKTSLSVQLEGNMGGVV